MKLDVNGDVIVVGDYVIVLSRYSDWYGKLIVMITGETKNSIKHARIEGSYRPRQGSNSSYPCNVRKIEPEDLI